ncbi:MAG: histidinol-phosphate transaminase [Saprospiraceae bacterium]
MSFNLNKLVRPNIQKMVAYSSARSEFKGKADVFLDANENPFDTGLNRYPDPLQRQLKKEISAIKNVPTEQIFLGNGSDEAIDLLIRIFCEPQRDHIITVPPTYGMYKVSAAISDIEVKTVLLTEDFQLRPKAILAEANQHSKILFLCSPNNPTGNDVNRADIEFLLEKFKGVVVVDEAYIDFSELPSCTTLLEKYPNLVVLQTFSKAWGLAGIRLGMAFASKAIIQLFNKVKPPYNVNQLTQTAALEALQNKQQRAEWNTTILEQRNWLIEQLEQIAVVEKVYPSAANFLLFKIENPNDWYNYLVQQGVIIRNRSTVVLCDGCLRVTVGTPSENQRFVNLLQSRLVNV